MRGKRLPSHSKWLVNAMLQNVGPTALSSRKIAGRAGTTRQYADLQAKKFRTPEQVKEIAKKEQANYLKLLERESAMLQGELASMARQGKSPKEIADLKGYSLQYVLSVLKQANASVPFQRRKGFPNFQQTKKLVIENKGNIKLSEKQRTAVELRYVQGKKLEEIGKIMGVVSKRAVDQNIRRALYKIRNYLRQKEKHD
ncbi:MAG: sigma factor-like helix-turn-helix DNA-binding protein [Candidatus Diapherotrites archaeon]